MEKPLAINRVPTEIWLQIFSPILHTWLLPGSGDDILDDIFLFSTGCESYAEYRRVEGNRRQLQAVCRQWKRIADYFVINLVPTRFENITLISKQCLKLAERIELLRDCDCRQCPSRLSRGLEQPRADEASASQPNSDSPLSLECVQVISWGSHSRVDPLIDAKYIKSAINLRALEVQAVNLKSITIPENLTHLSILQIKRDYTPATLTLPRLQFLSLSLLLYGNTKSPWESFDHWLFPKLISLCIYGYVEMGIHHDSLRRFIRNHAHNLKNFVPAYKPLLGIGQVLAPAFDFRLLRQYPRLKVLGMSMMRLKGLCDTYDPSDTDGSPPPSLSLLLIDDVVQYLSRLTDSPVVAGQCLSLCAPQTAVFNRIVMIHSWQRAIQAWETGNQNSLFNIDEFNYPRKFFKGLYKTNIVFVDRDGVELREGDGLKFLERLGLTDFD
ncbi:hypothetical protein FRC14_002437 [Serendipita sp. 396]|nr:hypothetical protein FRC14_002437 [Serendipita sp. 396]